MPLGVVNVPCMVHVGTVDWLSVGGVHDAEHACSVDEICSVHALCM